VVVKKMGLQLGQIIVDHSARTEVTLELEMLEGGG
jgi:hypothetical protein